MNSQFAELETKHQKALTDAHATAATLKAEEQSIADALKALKDLAEAQ